MFNELIDQIHNEIKDHHYTSLLLYSEERCYLKHDYFYEDFKELINANIDFVIYEYQIHFDVVFMFKFENGEYKLTRYKDNNFKITFYDEVKEFFENISDEAIERYKQYTVMKSI